MEIVRDRVMARLRRSRTNSGLATVALASACAYLSFSLATPARAPTKWSTVSNLQHIWSKDEFEREVLARLDNLEGFERIQEYTIPKASMEQMNQDRINFMQSWLRERFVWKDEKEKGVPQGEASYECDLYLRTNETIPLDTFFCDSFTHVRCLTHGEWHNISFGVLLSEVAQTPKSLRGKLWQIERALKFGPEDISQPQCCVVCLNGEEGQFEAAAEAAREELSILAQDAALNNFPVFAIFTEYRNTYAELRQVNQKVDDVNQKVDDVNQKVDYVNQKVDDLQKDLKEIRDLLVRRDGQNNSAN
jgi:hypothetical protein